MSGRRTRFAIEWGHDRETWHGGELARIVIFAASVFYVAGGLFLLTFALGLLVQFRFVDTKPFRWLHHALFFFVFVSAIVAVLVGFIFEAPYRWALLPVLVLFTILPRVRAGTSGHAALACTALTFYTVGFLWSL